MAQIVGKQFARTVAKDARVKELLKSVKDESKSTDVRELVDEALREHKQKRTRKTRASRVLSEAKREVVRIETTTYRYAAG